MVELGGGGQGLLVLQHGLGTSSPGSSHTLADGARINTVMQYFERPYPVTPMVKCVFPESLGNLCSSLDVCRLHKSIL